MDSISLRKARSFQGEFTPPPDKSVSHRAVFFCAVAKGKSRVRNFLFAHDPMSTVAAFRTLGIEIATEGKDLVIEGNDLHGLREPETIIDCGNSGTTTRLLTGLLSGHPFLSVLTGDESIRKRPMARVIQPCREMGATILARDNGNFPPLVVLGGSLRPIRYTMPVASAQVKSAIILAALYAEGITEIREPFPSRDHTERMLPAFGAKISSEGGRISVSGLSGLSAQEVEVPGDFSSAAFFLAAALLVPGGELIIRNCGLNPTRTGFLDAVRRMGAAVTTENLRTVSGEPIADIVCRYSPDLRATVITEAEIPLLIDEFPVLSLLASQAEGLTEIRGAAELRVKESDRIAAMAGNLRLLGVQIEEQRDGLTIPGKAPLRGARVQSHGDHRIAMTMAVASLIAEGETIIEGVSSVDISFPGFFDTLGTLCR